MKQHGFALLSVLLVMALVAVLIGTLIYQQGRTLAQVTVLDRYGESLAVTQGLEQWVSRALQEDARASHYDGLDELWARPLPPTLFAGGEVSGWLTDAQARVNVNNLVLAPKVARPFWRQVVARLLAAQPTTAAEAEQWRARIEDWIDADEEPLPQGAESPRYQLAQPARRCADVPMIHLGELRWVLDFPQVAIRPLQGVMVALPQATGVNVNTAPLAVLTAVLPEVDRTVLARWVQVRKGAPARSVETFVDWLRKHQGADFRPDWPDGALTVETHYFVLHTHVRFDTLDAYMNSLIYRTEKTSGVRMRWRAEDEDERTH